MSRAMEYRRRWVPAALVLLVGSLLLGPLPPAEGVDGEVDHPALYSACVGSATESAGFRDMVGNFAEEAANCLAHYRITLGTAEGVFSPSNPVPRWQMALFLVRAARPAGIVVPPSTDQGFTDLDQVGAHTRAAINQLAALKIMEGTSASTFAPFATVTRQQMALLLSRVLKVAPTGPGGAHIAEVKPDDDIFRDLSQVSVTTHTAIRKLYELGVTSGTSAATFLPKAGVSRAQMAVFITRMLAHTNARPAGLTVQTATPEVFKDSDVRVTISLRDSDHQPFADRDVDIFVASDPSKAFDDQGRCTEHVSPVVGHGPCIVDDSDAGTGPSGNVAIDVEVGAVDGLRIWIWTGERKATFDEDGTDAVVVDITTLSSATALKVTDDLRPSARKVRFGQAVTFTLQVIDDDGDPVAKAGHSLIIVVEESRDNGRSFERTTISKETGRSGSSQVTFRHSDPSDEPGDVAQLDLDIRSSGNLEVQDGTTIKMVSKDGSSNDPFLDWADEPDEPTTLKLSVTREYRVASSDGDGAGATVRATLTDQYGSPVAHKQIVFTSNDAHGVPNGVRRSTNSSGVATLHYQRDSAASVAERITGKFGRLAATGRQYWASPVSAAVVGSGEVRLVETDDNALVVVSGSDVLLIEYDANDQFFVDKEPVRIARFEEDLTSGDILAYDITDPNVTTVNSFTLTNR